MPDDEDNEENEEDDDPIETSDTEDEPAEVTDSERYYAMVRGGRIGASGATKTLVIGVLECNRKAVAVYRNCTWDTESSDAGLMMLGISALEIQAAMNVLGVPETERADVMADVRYMEHVASRIYAGRLSAQVEKMKRALKSGRGGRV